MRVIRVEPLTQISPPCYDFRKCEPVSTPYKSRSHSTIGSMDVELEPNYLIIVTIRGTVLSKLWDKLHAFHLKDMAASRHSQSSIRNSPANRRAVTSKPSTSTRETTKTEPHSFLGFRKIVAHLEDSEGTARQGL